jgi:hypothetical protein
VETESTYFTRRARQERTSAAEAASAEARTAHLELAFRLVRAATEPSFRSDWLGRATEKPIARRHKADLVEEVGAVLGGAFPLPGSSTFEHLLMAVDLTNAHGRDS